MINLTNLPQPDNTQPSEPLHPDNSAQNFYRVLNRRGVKAFLVLVAIALIIGAILRALTPPPVRVPQTKFLTTNLNGTTSSFSNVRYIGPDFTVPSELPVVNAQTTGTSTSDIQNRLIEKFDLTAAREPSNLWVGLDFYLSYDSRQSRYILQNQMVTQNPDAATTTINKAQAVTAAQTFLHDIFPDTPIAPLESEMLFFSDYDEHYNEVSESNARQVTIPFAYLIEGYPLFYEKQSEFPFEVTVNNANEVVKVSFAPQFLTITTLQNAEIISPAAALSNLNERSLGALVKAQNRAVDNANLSQVVGGQLTRGSLEYRLDPETHIAFPVYRFDGSITLESGSVLDASIITPAVATTTP